MNLNLELIDRNKLCYTDVKNNSIHMINNNNLDGLYVYINSYVYLLILIFYFPSRGFVFIVIIIFT